MLEDQKAPINGEVVEGRITEQHGERKSNSDAAK
jgi:hypothetical protein